MKLSILCTILPCLFGRTMQRFNPFGSELNDLQNTIWGLQCWNWQEMDCPRYQKRTQTCVSAGKRPPRFSTEYSVETMWPYASNRNCVYHIRCPKKMPVIKYYFERFGFQNGDRFTIDGVSTKVTIGKKYTKYGPTMTLRYVSELNREKAKGLEVFWSCAKFGNEV